MKYLLLLLAIPIISASECGSKKEKTPPAEEKVVPAEETVVTTDSVPPCVRKLIDDTKGKPSGPVKIDAYLYKNHTVYLMTAPCCDQYNLLYDDSCNRMCAPSGGFTGKGDSKCKDFTDSSKFVKQIWKMGDK